MLLTIRDDTLNVLNILHITSNWKRWNYSDTPNGGHISVIELMPSLPRSALPDIIRYSPTLQVRTVLSHFIVMYVRSHKNNYA